MLRRALCRQEIEAVLSRASNHCGLHGSASRDHQELGCVGPSGQMGHRFDPLHHLLPASHRHQVTGAGRLPRRLGRDPVPATGTGLHPLEDAF